MNTRLKCLLLDDEIPGLSYLKLLCEQVETLEVVKTFVDPELLIKEAPDLDFDLCILDIEMPGKNGIEIAKLLHGKPVIFTTAYKEYATNAFDLDALDYLVKPITLERLQKAINKAIQRVTPVEKANRIHLLNTDKGIAPIVLDQLLYVHTAMTDSRDKRAYLADGTMFTLKNITFEKLALILPSNKFCRINKAEMISLSTVRYFSNDQITANLGISFEKPMVLQLGEIYRNDFIRKIKS